MADSFASVEERRAYHLERYRRVITEYINSLGGKCTKCQSTNDLQFDHIDPRTKSFNISIGWSKPPHEVYAELAKCQLLCIDCHKNKTQADAILYGTCAQHGTIHMYQNKGCRCAKCSLAQSDWRRKLRRRKKLSS